MALVLLLIVQGLVLLVFAIAAFWWLFALRRRAVARSGSTMPGLRDSLTAFREGLTHPRYLRLRLIIFCSVALLVVSAPLVSVVSPA